MLHAKFLLVAAIFTLATAEYQIGRRTVHGHDAVPGQFPFYVYLEVLLHRKISECGGSLISNEWILTAGHCVDNAVRIKVYLGSLRVDSRIEPGRKIFAIHPKDVYKHPHYSVYSFDMYKK